jgi:hypothetical protein
MNTLKIFFHKSTHIKILNFFDTGVRANIINKLTKEQKWALI